MAEEQEKNEVNAVQDKKAAEKPKKKKSLLVRILNVFAVLILILIILVAALLIFLDKIVKTTVTTVGPEVTGTPMALAEFDSSLFNGEVTVTGLAVGNPDGYQSPAALAFDSLYIKINNESLLTDKIIVEEVIVDGLQVDYEIQSGLDFGSLFSGNFGDFAHSESNLTRILENVEAFAQRMSAGKTDDADGAEQVPAEETPSEEASTKEVVINHILVKNTTISFSSAMLNTSVAIPMPDFEITETEETSYADVISTFFQELYTNVIEAVAIYLRDNSLQLASAIGEGISDISSTVAEQAGNITSAVGEQFDNITSGVGEQMNNLKETLSLDKLF